MKNSIFFFLSLILLLYACEKKEYTISEVISSTVTNYNNHNSISFDIQYRMKYLSEEDTLSQLAHCDLIRDINDSLFFGTLWLTAADSIEKYYDQKTIFSVSHKAALITEYQDPQNQKWAIKGSEVGDIYNVYFLQPEKLMRMIQDSTNQIQINDTLIDQKTFWKITVRYPDEPPFSESKKCIWINKKELSISKITFQIKFQNNYQFNEWTLSNINFDEIDKSLLEKKFENLRKKYSSITYSENQKNELKPLENGEAAPDFKGKLYPGNEEIKLSDYQGKMVILDFWYMSCYPCIKAIPHISELRSKYGNKGLIILGLNIDSDEKREKRLPDFIQINNMNYPIVFIDKDVPKSYNVAGYPTFYIIDKQGKILFSQSGYSENMNDTISTIIEKELF
jgi:thiol-disulfide isomerase/thioredoxin